MKKTATSARNWTPSAEMRVNNLNHCTNQFHSLVDWVLMFYSWLQTINLWCQLGSYLESCLFIKIDQSNSCCHPHYETQFIYFIKAISETIKFWSLSWDVIFMCWLATLFGNILRNYFFLESRPNNFWNISTNYETNKPGSS